MAVAAALDLGPLDPRVDGNQEWMGQLASMRRGNAAPLIPAQEGRDAGRVLVVFDLDETLIHTDARWHVLMRPHTRELLALCAQHCELAFWTAGTRPYAKQVLSKLEAATWGVSPAGRVRHLISRETEGQPGGWWDPRNQGKFHLKDLRRLGRDMRRVLIVENRPESVRWNPDSAVIVDDFRGGGDAPVLMRLRDLVHELSQLSPHSAVQVPELLHARCAPAPGAVLQRREHTVDGHGGPRAIHLYHVCAGTPGRQRRPAPAQQAPHHQDPAAGRWQQSPSPPRHRPEHPAPKQQRHPEGVIRIERVVGPARPRGASPPRERTPPPRQAAAVGPSPRQAAVAGSERRRQRRAVPQLGAEWAAGGAGRRAAGRGRTPPRERATVVTPAPLRSAPVDRPQYVIGMLPSGAGVVVTEEPGGWCALRAEDAGGQVRWADAPFTHGWLKRSHPGGARLLCAAGGLS